MTEAGPVPEFGILDTSVVIDYAELDSHLLPPHRAITTVTLAELHAGPNAARPDAVEQALRQQRLNWAQRIFRNPLPFDQDSALAFGAVHLLVQEAGRKPRKYHPDLMIASIAIRNQLPLYTRSPKDFEPVTPLLEVISI